MAYSPSQPRPTEGSRFVVRLKTRCPLRAFGYDVAFVGGLKYNKQPAVFIQPLYPTAASAAGAFQTFQNAIPPPSPSSPCHQFPATPGSRT